MTVDADGSSDIVDDAAADDESSTCPVCGEPDCEQLFHVHLSVPWR